MSEPPSPTASLGYVGAALHAQSDKNAAAKAYRESLAIDGHLAAHASSNLRCAWSEQALLSRLSTPPQRTRLRHDLEPGEFLQRLDVLAVHNRLSLAGVPKIDQSRRDLACDC
jgi:hypothetical protein